MGSSPVRPSKQGNRWPPGPSGTGGTRQSATGQLTEPSTVGHNLPELDPSLLSEWWKRSGTRPYDGYRTRPRGAVIGITPGGGPLFVYRAGKTGKVWIVDAATAKTLANLYPLGQVVDEGDTLLQTRRLIKGRRFSVQRHDGVEFETTAADRVPNTTPAVPATTGRIETVRDLRQDKKFTRTYVPADEFGTPSTEPFEGTMTHTTANPELLNVTDNGDGSAVYAAVGGGALGPALVTFTATPTVGAPIIIEDTINIVAGSPEGFTATDSPDEEVTPDA